MTHKRIDITKESMDFGMNHSIIKTPVGQAKLNIEAFDIYSKTSGDKKGNIHPHSIIRVLRGLEDKDVTHYKVCFDFKKETEADDFVEILPKSIHPKKGHHLDDNRTVCINTQIPTHNKRIKERNINALRKLKVLIQTMKEW